MLKAECGTDDDCHAEGNKNGRCAVRVAIENCEHRIWPEADCTSPA
jgi:hypothetical protein